MRRPPLAANACPSCGALMQETTGPLSLPVNGETITVPDAPHLRCSGCPEVVLRLDEARSLRERVFTTYRQRFGLLLPTEIRALRERRGLTQGALAQQLRLGANTLSRWESGRTVQTAALDLLMRLYRDVPGADGIAPVQREAQP